MLPTIYCVYTSSLTVELANDINGLRVVQNESQLRLDVRILFLKVLKISHFLPTADGALAATVILDFAYHFIVNRVPTLSRLVDQVF
jgi:hypothetical protein